jgi:tRNA pseudouridine32 synthase/23S rRNA pseudouridine746 synthase
VITGFSESNFLSNEKLFIKFSSSYITEIEIPSQLPSPFNNEPHPIAVIACEELMLKLPSLSNSHNFGLLSGDQRPVIGKMFGVLVVENINGDLGYLSGFSGKIAGTYHLNGFVPPVFDSLTENSFLNIGMQELARINEEIRQLGCESIVDQKKIDNLKELRSSNSASLQQQLFQHYRFTNIHGETKSLLDIFQEEVGHEPPSGAGDCAAPRLFQYAYSHNLQPVAIAEFWWGLSPKTETWKHKQFYPACKLKCRPILNYMLQENYSNT